MVFSFVTAYGWGDYFMAANSNWTWSNSSALEDNVLSQIYSVRFGKNFKVGKKGHIAPTIGVQFQNITTNSYDSVQMDKIYQILDNPEINDAKQNINEKAHSWYHNLSKAQ